MPNDTSKNPEPQKPSPQPPNPSIPNKPDPALASQMTKGEQGQPIQRQRVEVAAKPDPNLKSTQTFNEPTVKNQKSNENK